MNLPQRKQTRLPDYDYASNGAYFITICTENRQKILSTLRRGDPCGRPPTALTELGEIAERTLFDLEKRYELRVDYYVIMPDHIHAVLLLSAERATARVAPTIGQVVGAYKSLVSHDWRIICNQRNLKMGKLWQRGFFDHVIRNEEDLMGTRAYIENNPIKWLETHQG